jgi:MFS family permease
MNHTHPVRARADERIKFDIGLCAFFALGIGLAFSGPVWAAIVPEVVSKDELASAVTLGGVQLNIAAIVGPPLGGFLMPFLGIPVLFFTSALPFLIVALVLLQWKQRRTQSSGPRESFKESLINLLRYAHNSSRMKIILFRNLLFSLVISVVPSLLPVIAFQELQCSAAQFGLFFTSVGIGSLAGAASNSCAASPEEFADGPTSSTHQPFQSYPYCLESGLRHAVNRIRHSTLILIRHTAT